MFCTDCGIYTVGLNNPVIPNSCLVKNHCLIKTTVYKLNEVFLIAWEEGMILEGYVAQVLLDNGWNTLFSVEVHGLEGGRHEVDVIAEKDNNYLLIECKHVAPYNWVLYDDAIKSIGKMTLIEGAILKAYRKRKEQPSMMIKAIITTGEATKRNKCNDLKHRKFPNRVQRRHTERTLRI